MSAATQLAAAEVDLFPAEAPVEIDVAGVANAEDVANAVRTACVTFTGRLTRDAEVRAKPVDDIGHHAPVLCVEIEVLAPVKHVVRGERPYTEATRKEAEAEAARLKKGRLVRLSSPLLDMRVYLPRVEIFPHQP
jgi:hypothetical protein